jgi:hypothetical protein
VELLPVRVGAEDGDPDHDRGGGDGDGTDRDSDAVRRSAAPGVDPSAQRVRRLGLGRGRTRERDGALLLGEARRQLGGGGDLRLDIGAPVVRDRAVGERRQLGGLAVVLVAARDQRHGNPNGTGFPMPLETPRGDFHSLGNTRDRPVSSLCEHVNHSERTP